jgi:hypothetical protein
MKQGSRSSGVAAGRPPAKNHPGEESSGPARGLAVGEEAIAPFVDDLLALAN